MIALDGPQIELATKDSLKITPSSAIRSMFGVPISELPYALIARSEWSSDMMKRMLGRASLPSSTESVVQAAMTIISIARVSNIVPVDVVFMSRWALCAIGTMMPERWSLKHNIKNL